MVRTLAREFLPPGRYEIRWNGETEGGERAPAGIYFIRMKSPGETGVHKLVLVR